MRKVKRHHRRFKMKMGLSLLTFLLATGCVSEVDLEVDGGKTFVIVDGQLTDSLKMHQIRVSSSAILGVGNDNILTPVSGASVCVYDDDGNCYDFTESEAGLYEREMAGVPGSTYYLEVSIGSRMIRSQPSQLEIPIPVDRFGVEVIIEENINAVGNVSSEEKLVVYVDTEIPNDQQVYFRWDVGGEYAFSEWYLNALNLRTCIVKDNVGFNNIRILSAEDVEGSLIDLQEIVRTPLNYRFSNSYCFHVSQLRVSKEEYDFWNSVISIINIDGSLFDPPPGSVKGNLYNVGDENDQILGYFSVAGVSYRRFFVNAGDLGYYVEPRCARRRNAENVCRDCTRASKSTLEIPEYWEFD